MWRGLAIGVLISAPMGPVGILCVQRTLDKGRRTGFYTGVGAAISDLIYCLLTGFGLSFIEEFLERNSNVIQLVGSLVLIGFGVYILRKDPAAGLQSRGYQDVSFKKNVLGGFLFTVSNPLIIFLIIGLFARFNFMMPDITFYHYIVGFMCIIGGALLWWWVVTYSVDKVRSHFNIRSMWLINKVIGVVILLFALVGIVSGVAAYAGNPFPGGYTRCWNARRGYSGLTMLPDSAGNLVNTGSDTLSALAVLKSPGADFEMRFLIENRRVNPNKKYKYTDTSGLSRSVAMPAWQIVVYDTSGKEVSFLITSEEGGFDGISTRRQLCVATGGVLSSEKIVAGHTDASGATNVFSLQIKEGELCLKGGNHGLKVIAARSLPAGFSPMASGWKVMPGGAVRIDDVRLTEYSGRSGNAKSPWLGGSLVDEYLADSEDPMEGYWLIYDRSLEESLVRLGGDYRLAMVRSDDGYDLLYMSGAVTNAGSWTPGMVKCRLRPSGADGIWRVEWTDSMFVPISNEVQAQVEGDSGLIKIQFPYHRSSMRLIRQD